jgi:hypothetical protein
MGGSFRPSVRDKDSPDKASKKNRIQGGDEFKLKDQETLVRIIFLP